MLSIEYLNEEISRLSHNIKIFEKKDDKAQTEYAEHLKRLKLAYEAELKKAYKRPIKPLGDEPDKLDYIQRFFPRDRSLI